MVPLFYKRLTQTDGDSVSWSYIDLDLPQVADWGPHLHFIQAHTMTELLETNFSWKIVFFSSLDGKTWMDPVDLFTAITSEGQQVQASYSTGTSFGLKMKYALAVKNTTGSSRTTATLSCALNFAFLT